MTTLGGLKKHSPSRYLVQCELKGRSTLEPDVSCLLFHIASFQDIACLPFNLTSQKQVDDLGVTGQQGSVKFLMFRNSGAMRSSRYWVQVYLVYLSHQQGIYPRYWVAREVTSHRKYSKSWPGQFLRLSCLTYFILCNIQK